MAISIEIRGDYTGFQQDMARVRSIARQDARAISEAMNNSISMNAAATQMTGLVKNFNIAARSAQSVKADASAAMDAVRKMGEAAGVSGRQFEKMAQQAMKMTTARQLENSMRNIQRVTGVSAMEMARLRVSVGDVSGGVRTMASYAKESVGHFINLRNAIVASAAAVAFNKFADLSSEYTDLESRIGIVTGSMETASSTMERLRDIADRAYAPLQSTAESFLANATALNDLGYSTEKQLNLTEAMTNALVVSGAKGNQAAMVIDAMGRAMSIGALKGQEFNMVLKYGPRLAQALTDSLSVSVNELRQMAKDGQLTSDVIADALIKNVQQLRDEAETMPATINDAFTKLRNQIFMTVGEIDKMQGVSGAVVKNIDGITESLQKNQSTIGDIISGVAWLMGTIVDFAGASYRGLQKVTVGWIALGDAAVSSGAAMVKIFKTMLNPFSGSSPAEILADWRGEMDRIGKTVNSLDAEIGDVLPSAARSAAAGLETAANAADNSANAAWNAEAAYRDLAAAMALIGGMGVAVGNSMESDMKILTDFTKQARSAAVAARDQAKANADLAWMSLDAQRQKFIDNGDFEKALELNIQLERQADLLREVERGEIGLENARSGRRGGGSKRRGQSEEDKDQKEYVRNLQEQLRFYEQLREVMPAAGEQYDAIRQQLLALEEEQYRAIGISEEFLSVWRDQTALREATDAISGLRVAMTDYLSELTGANMAQDFFTTSAQAISSMLYDTVTGAKSAKEAFGDMATTIVNKLIEIMIQMYVMKPIVEWMQSALGGGGGGGGLLGSLFGGLMGAASAKGNVFSAGPGISGYSSQVVTSPTVFPFAKGVGLMGEAGAEAVMPLRRNSRGQLGVIVAADGYNSSASAPAPSVNVQVINQTSVQASPEVSTNSGPGGSLNMKVMLREVDRGLTGLKAQGQSQYARSIESDGGLYASQARKAYMKG